MRASVEEDIVVGVGKTVVGPEVPPELRGLTPMQLRFVDGEVVDATSIREWHVDDSGQKHAVPAPGRTKLTCAWDDWLIRDGIGWRVETPEELAARSWAPVRRQRDRLLAQSDWSQLPDAPLSERHRAAWRVYRQQLRDVPQTFECAGDVSWPDPPTRG